MSVAASLLSPSHRLDTLPTSLVLFATAVANAPVSAAIASHGRRRTFVAAAAVGAAAAAGAAAAVATLSFGGLCAAACVMGVGNAAAQQYRFAAAELVPPHARPFAIASVLSGGVVGAAVGPEYAKRARLLLPAAPFSGVFIISAAVCTLNASLISLVPFSHVPPPPPTQASPHAPPPPLRALLAQPARWSAVIIGSVSWFVMTFLMVPVPLAMTGAGFSFNDASLVVQLHMLAMYLPSFATGRVVATVGTGRAIVAGTAVLGAAMALFAAGAQLPHYLVGELLVGFGWNLQFVGATAALAATAGGPRVAAANDVCVFIAAGAGALSGAPALRALGWRSGQQVAAGGASAVVLVALAAQAVAERRARARAAPPLPPLASP
jgi:predicted MFS family arabinose efflux permease